MKNIFVVTAIAALRLTAATIVWDDAQNVTADTDVSTEGDLVCAFNEDNVDATVNGVLFTGYISHDKLPKDSQEPYIQLANFGESRTNTFCVNFTPTSVLTAPYVHLLKGGAFNRNAGQTATATLLGLQTGEDYLVQIWIADNRAGSSGRITVLDEVCEVNCQPASTVYGQWTVGRFRADSGTQTISLYGTQSAQLNAIQVRKLSSIKWETPVTTGDGSEVKNVGTTLYAYHFDGSHGDQIVNGVTFKQGGHHGLFAEFSQDVDVAHDGGTGRTLQSSNGGALDTRTVYPEGTPDAYKVVVGSALYAANGSGPSWIDLTLKHLIPGRRYLVQIWYVDARYEAETCALYQKVDDVRTLVAYNREHGDAGQCVSGTFVASTETKTFRVRGYNTRVSTKSNPLFNALQVRDITAAADILANDVAYLTGETEIRSDGTPVYAYTVAAENLTVNGVTFTSQSSSANWGAGNVTLDGLPNRTTSAFRTGSTSFDKLLAGGVYARSTEINGQNPASATLTFKGLEPLKTYLVQVIVNDSRTGVEDRRVLYPGRSDYVYYQNPAETSKYGSCYTVTVRPRTTSHLMTLLYTANRQDNISPQINAVQVRLLSDAVGGAALWTGGSSGNWSITGTDWTSDAALPAEPWSTANGAARDAVVPDGTVLTVAAGVTVRNIVAKGDLTLSGDTPRIVGEIVGGNVTIDSPWTEYALVKACEGTLSLTGDRTALRFVTVSEGTLSLGTGAASDLRSCIVYPNGSLVLSGDRGILSGTISGTLETRGPVTAAGEVVFTPGWTLVRTTGAAMTIDRATFDLSTLSCVKIDHAELFSAEHQPILRVTGTFTGNLPSLETDKRGYSLKIVETADGHSLNLVHKGCMVIFR
jgi:hypothetical protein